MNLQGLKIAPRSPYGDVPLPVDLLFEATDPHKVEVARNVSVGYLLLNRHLVGESSPIVSIGGFMSDVTTPDRAWEGIQLASLDRPVLMLDIPGHGSSTPHSREQIIDLCVRRKADSEAAPLTDAVQRLLNPQDQIDYFGISHGAFLSLKAAELDPGDRVKTVFGIELPAVYRRPTLGLQLGYFVLDSMIGRKKYLEMLENSQYEQDFEHFKKIHGAMDREKANKFYMNNPGLFLLNLFMSVNARPGALDSWRTIMENKQAEVSVVTAEHSHVSNPEAIDEFINDLDVKFQDRSKQIVIRGEDHNIGIVHLMPRAAAWAKAAYNS